MADQEEPKIIVDEDWKSQVEREREEAEQASEQAEEVGEEEAGEEKADSPFDRLVGYLATQAMGALGLFTEPDGGRVPVHLDLAQFMINSLAAVRDKTAGNLEPQEEGRLTAVIADLQRAFVSCSQAVHEAALQGGEGPGPAGPGPK